MVSFDQPDLLYKSGSLCKSRSDSLRSCSASLCTSASESLCKCASNLKQKSVPVYKIAQVGNNLTTNSKGYGYSIPNGPGTMGGPKHDTKKHGTSPALGTIDRAANWPDTRGVSAWAATPAHSASPKHGTMMGGPIAARFI